MAEIDATPGGANANAYADVTFADVFLLEERVGGSAWDAVADKPAALVMAAQQLDRLRFKGVRASTSQALEWPRSGAVDRDGVSIASTIIPVGVKRANAELALWLSQADRTTPGGGDVLEELEAGPIKLKFRDLPGGGGILSAMPDVVSGHLVGLTVGTTGGGSGFRKVLRA